MDAYGRKSLALADGRALHLEGEVASIIGSTSRPFTGETVDGASVRSLGALLRFRLEDRGSRTQTQLELGYASGDNDPGDDVARAFSFHSDCNVGLVLFDQVLPALGARAVDRLADPVLMARRPTSLRYVVNQGAVQGAAYFNPTVRWRPTSAVDVRLGYLLAASAGLSFDPYHTGLNGGYAAGYDGRAAAATLFGHEFDAAVGFTLPLPAGLSVRAGVEGGILLPGAALAGVSDLGNPWMVRTRLDLRFGGLRR